MIRALQIGDLPAIKQIAYACFPERWGDADFLYFLEHDSRCNVGEFSETQQLECYFLGLLVFDVLDVISIATAPASRRRGRARALVTQVLSDVRVNEAFLEVDIENVPARAFYRSVGFQESGVRKKYYQGKRDAVLMRWKRI